jgi:hypothetical protein
MAAKQLKFYWSPQFQLFSCDGAKLEGHGFIQTNPSHDLVHLFIAANGNMPWQPVESREQTCFAEYNAVMLEHLLVNCFNAAVLGSMAPEQIVPEARKFLKWVCLRALCAFSGLRRRGFSPLCRGFGYRLHRAAISLLLQFASLGMLQPHLPQRGL